jgi:hypothetical protein
MPLCPQITNTPVTVTQTGDFVVTSVVPLIADTTDGLANNFESIEILADGKTKVYRQNDEPTGAGINDGDLWIDINDGNKLYVRVSGAWVSAQDAAIGTAQAAANAAAAAAATAQADATAALADAAIAYTTAQNSLQGSAFAIQDPTTKQLTSIDATGLTVFSGGSATSGPRIVMNSLGIAAYGSGSSVNITNAVGNGTTVTYTASGHSFTVGKNITVSGLAPAGYNGAFVITAVSAGSTFTVANTTTATLTDANGVAEFATLAISATTGNAVFSGSVTGSTIIGGTLNIAGKAVINASGILQAEGATIQGTVNAEAGYFGTVSNGWSIDATGLVAQGSGTIVGGTISTSSATNRISMGGGSNSLSFFYLGSATAHLLATTGGAGARLHYGATADGSGNPYPSLDLDSSGVAIEGSATYQIASTSLGNIVYGNILCNSGVTVTGAPIYTGDATSTPSTQTEGISLTQGGTVSARRSNNNPLNLHIFDVTAAAGTSVEVIQFIRNGTNRGTLEVFGNTTAPTLVGSSDYRLKENIRDYTESLDKLLATKVRVFNEVEDADHNDVIGFVAHEFAEVFPNMVNGEKDAVDIEGNPIYQKLSYSNLIPHLVGAIQALHKEVQTLKGE